MGVLALAGCSDAGSDADERADARRLVLETLDDAWRGDSPFDRPAGLEPQFFLPSGWGYKIQECMIAAGHPDFGYDPENGFRSDGRPARTDGVPGLALYACIDRLPTYDTRYSALRGSQLNDLWEYYEEFLVPCLTLQGITVTDVPDRAAFAGEGPGMPGAWNPWLTAEIPATVAATRAGLAACAPYPTGWEAPAAD